jgi:hypothetical protein
MTNNTLKDISSEDYFGIFDVYCTYYNSSYNLDLLALEVTWNS